MSLAFSKTPKTGFVASRPIWVLSFIEMLLSDFHVIQFHGSIDYHELSYYTENSVDHDQLDSSEASYSGSTLFWFHIVFKRVCI